ncbi:helix-turn-helix domain-containing protein [Streptomyces sp. PA03-1a]|nr:helix-turn-helix domain-containing protein [Streptomyces sp. PA03-1a]MDX2816769.1 helix-turn-helix domain-containing protein [Streptomyces sp. PA03-5A]
MSAQQADLSSTDDAVAAELSALYRWATQEVGDLVPAIVDDIRGQVGSFEAMPRAEHEEAVLEQYQAFLASLQERRAPTGREIEAARELGRRRARQFVPMESVITGFHIGYRHLWSMLRQEAGNRQTAALLALLELVDQTWAWVQHMCGAVADGYSETSRGRETALVELRHRFVEALYADGAQGEDGLCMARALDFDPYASFQAACAPVEAWSDTHFDLLRRKLHANGGTLHAVIHGERVVILAQGMIIADAGELLPAGVDPVAGIGMPRAGLAGAAESIGDAERALVVARERGCTVSFDDKWLIATLLPQRDRLAPLVRSTVPRSHPRLAEAVLAFAHNGFSISASAAVLHLHPNTVSYRLDRWHHHTGWDPRSWDGLARSLAAIVLYPPENPGR